MVYLEFVNKRILEGSEFFFKNLEKELGSLKEIKAEIQSKGEREN